MKIVELKDGDKKVEVEGTITEKGDVRTVKAKRTGEEFKVADFVLGDDSGQINLVLWNEAIDRVRINDKLRISNGYVKSFRDVAQLSVGKYGTLTVL